MTQHIQELVDAAYDGWQLTPRKSYDDFIFDLPVDQKEAVLIGNLNYQVENGGFSQWFSNGYGDHAAEVRLVLDRIGGHAAYTITNLILIACNIWRDDKDDGDFDAQDQAFYKINDQLLADANTYFASKVVHA